MTQLAKPFLKWAGGKTQLISEIQKSLPENLSQFTYIEPFVGSGAVLFWLVQNYPGVKKVVINDINIDLINTYKVIANNPHDLINVLHQYECEFHSKINDVDRKLYYYEKRKIFNNKTENTITQSALLIFLNKTCFNGLYRVNKKGEFNVPMGSYKKPTICDSTNILACSKVLRRSEILCGDYQEVLRFVDDNSFFYFDPPYKPLTKTSNFNSYSSESFGNNQQIRLAEFCDKISNLNHKFILSNSDTGDNFFDNLYSQYKINRVKAKRSINSSGSKRGEINELLIKNF